MNKIGKKLNQRLNVEKKERKPPFRKKLRIDSDSGKIEKRKKTQRSEKKRNKFALREKQIWLRKNFKFWKKRIQNLKRKKYNFIIRMKWKNKKKCRLDYRILVNLVERGNREPIKNSSLSRHSQTQPIVKRRCKTNHSYI